MHALRVSPVPQYDPDKNDRNDGHVTVGMTFSGGIQ